MGTLTGVTGGLVAHWLVPGLQTDREGAGVASALAPPDKRVRCHPVSSGPSRSTEAVASLPHTPAAVAALWCPGAAGLCPCARSGPGSGSTWNSSLWNSCRQTLQYQPMSHASAELEFGMLRLDSHPSGSPRAQQGAVFSLCRLPCSRIQTRVEFWDGDFCRTFMEVPGL